jgi:Holliday junction DNA helicase RuvA
MITFLDGKLVGALPTQAIVDVGGVGYEVFIPLSSYDKLPAVGQPVRILTHLHVREDAHILYGFMSAPERDLFRLLVNNVSGIGPKLALAVLSGMSVTNFKSAVVNSDVAALAKISGLGKKTAERIVLELKDKLGVAAAWEAATAAHAPTPEQEQANEAVLALIALGYKQVEAHRAVRKLSRKNPASPRRNWSSSRSNEWPQADDQENSKHRTVRAGLALNAQHRMSNSESALGVGRWALDVRR